MPCAPAVPSALLTITVSTPSMATAIVVDRHKCPLFHNQNDRTGRCQASLTAGFGHPCLASGQCGQGASYASDNQPIRQSDNQPISQSANQPASCNLEGLCQRCPLSTAEFYDKVGRKNPAALPRFTVVPNGNNEFGIVERSTGNVRGVHRGHSATCKAADQLEAQPVRQRSFATHMLRWTAAIATGLALFALYGAS